MANINKMLKDYITLSLVRTYTGKIHKYNIGNIGKTQECLQYLQKTLEAKSSGNLLKIPIIVFPLKREQLQTE